jgi:glucose/arabinose dehydrogenase
MSAERCWLCALALLVSLAPAAARAQSLDDPQLQVALVTSGLALPTTMAFVAPNDILVLEKNTGRVRRVQGGVLAPSPVLSVPVNASNERGLLGIAVNSESPPKVFLYYTEAPTLGGTAIANRVYRYDWNPGAGVLQNPMLLLELPVTPATNHHGGVLVLGPPGQAPGVGDGALLHAVIGDLTRTGQLQNVPDGPPPDDSSVILRVRQDGTPAPGNPFTPYCSVTTATTCSSDASCPMGETCLLAVARYYAYGVRNSFGLAVDPVTGALWDTENGPGNYDEVNRVEPGMNSGWRPIMGPDARDPNGVGELFQMPGAGQTYSDPEFSWLDTNAPTGILFPVGSTLGPDYDDVALVGDNNYSQIYAIPLNGARTAFDLAGIPGLADLVSDSDAERDAVRFGQGFGAVTDLELGPDGDVYVVSITGGAIYRVSGSPAVPALPALGAPLLAVLLGAGALLAAGASPERGAKA